MQTYTVLERIGPNQASIESVDLTLLHDGRQLHVICNNYKAGRGDEVEGCGLQVGQRVECQLFSGKTLDEGGGYDLICGSDRISGKLVTSARNELLTIQRDEKNYLLTHAEAFIHHYDGSPCGLWNKQSCDEPEIHYTFVGDKARIVAHCQSWDEHNFCGNLQVGTTYHCQVEGADESFPQTLSCLGVGEMGIDRSDLK